MFIYCDISGDVCTTPNVFMYTSSVEFNIIDQITGTKTYWFSLPHRHSQYRLTHQHLSQEHKWIIRIQITKGCVPEYLKLMVENKKYLIKTSYLNCIDLNQHSIRYLHLKPIEAKPLIRTERDSVVLSGGSMFSIALFGAV